MCTMHRQWVEQEAGLLAVNTFCNRNSFPFPIFYLDPGSLCAVLVFCRLFLHSCFYDYALQFFVIVITLEALV